MASARRPPRVCRVSIVARAATGSGDCPADQPGRRAGDRAPRGGGGRQGGLALLDRGAADLEDDARPAPRRRSSAAARPRHPPRAARTPSRRCCSSRSAAELGGRHLARDAAVDHHRHAVGDRRSRRRGSARSAAPRSRPRSASRVSISTTCSTMTGARPSVGSSITSSRGLTSSAAADRQHLLLAAGELGAAVAPALGQAREGLVDALDGPGPLGAVADQAQMLVHRERGPDAPALRHVADAAIGDLVGRQAEDLVAGEPDAAARAGTSPVIALHSVVLPMPLRPTTPSTPRSRRQATRPAARGRGRSRRRVGRSRSPARRSGARRRPGSAMRAPPPR